MAVGSGLGASLGVAAESTYGTYAVPLCFVEFDKESLRKTKNVVQGGGLAAGRAAQMGSARVVTSTAGEGDLEFDVTRNGIGWLLAQIFGGTPPTPVQQGATTAYQTTFDANLDAKGRSLTVQVGRPDTGGTVRPYTYLGSKVKDVEFSCGVQDPLGVKVSLDCASVSEAQTLATPSYPAAGVIPWHGGQMCVLAGTYGAETALTGVSKFALKIERPLATDDKIRACGQVAEPQGNGFLKVTGSIDIDFAVKAEIADRFSSDTPTSLVWKFTGPVISGSYAYGLQFNLPMVFFEADAPTVDGPDILKMTATWTAQLDSAAHPLVSAITTNTDSTL